ncbi:MAG TPA: ThuA domain-containing protein, partial [Roseimicrobium sp.]|nr:ThuA domain-containing protein [Roseimicrobium sp.]
MKATFSFLAVLLATAILATAAPLKALIVDGQNNHDWAGTTPLLKKYLEETGLFTVEVATTPQGTDLSSFNPKFDDYAVIISNYNGQPWSDRTKAAFEKYMRNGGGFVSVHAADNSFPEWKEYNRIIGLGGWGGRNEKSGPYVRFSPAEGKVTRDLSPGSGGNHGDQHPFLVEIRDTEHPITKGILLQWMHSTDELYEKLRG